MQADISTAFLVLVIGMITVFVILGLVVLTGHILIRVVNKFFPMPVVEISKKTEKSPPLIPNNYNKSTVAAIVSVVDIITKGKGRPEKIEKLN